MVRRVVITGAQGFLGRYLTAELLARDPEVEVIGVGRSERLQDAFTHHVHWGTTRVRAPLPEELLASAESRRYRYASLDLSDAPALTAFLRDGRPDAVIHLAGELRDAAPEKLFRGNVDNTVTLLEAIAGAGIEPPRVVIGSTGGVYGSPPEDALPLREDSPATPADLYAVSKRAAEDAARILARRYDISVLFARIFNAVGPGQDEHHFCGWLTGQIAAAAAGVGGSSIEVGPLNRTRDFIDARDVAAALRLVLERGMSGSVYNVASGIETALESVLFRALRLSALDRSVSVRRRPGRAEDTPRHFADIRRLRALGFTPRVSLDESLTDLSSYYRDTVARRAAQSALPQTSSAPGPLSVSVVTTHAYQVEIARGLFRELPSRLRALFPAARLVVLDDARVHELYGAELCAALDAPSITVLNDEISKSPERAQEIVESLYRLGFDRRSVLVNLGGGLVTDLGGYVASMYLRGVAYVNVPTTLLAQHDSAIGGKVAVNMPWAKNFVGAFHHPRAVFCDPELLTTLSDRDLSAGVAEAIKVALIDEPDLFELLEREATAVRARDVSLLGEIVRRSAAKKIAILARDPLEVDLRRSLNLGHTFGHPLEVELGYGALLHGEAVAFGIAVAAEIAHGRGLATRPNTDRIHALLRAYDLPPTVPRARLDAARGRLAEVRLVRAGKLNYVLPEAIGKVQIVSEVEDAEIARAIAAIAASPIIGASVRAR